MSMGNLLKKDGYLLVPSFISNETVKSVRDNIEHLLRQEKDFTLRPTTLLKSDLLPNIIFSKSFKEILYNLSYEYRYFIPNFTARKNLYIGWHTDDEFVEPDTEDLPSVLQCNIYLQSNSPQHGGGIDIATGTHLFSKNVKKELIQNNQITYETVETKAGDLLIFDYRVIHRSTLPSLSPKEDSRLALQWTVSKTVDRARMFIQYLIRRQQEKLHLSDFTDKRALSYFFDAANVRFPDSFDFEIRELINATGVIVPSVEEMMG